MLSSPIHQRHKDSRPQRRGQTHIEAPSCWQLETSYRPINDFEDDNDHDDDDFDDDDDDGDDDNDFDDDD